jgi:hypothetical protein
MQCVCVCIGLEAAEAHSNGAGEEIAQVSRGPRRQGIGLGWACMLVAGG